MATRSEVLSLSSAYRTSSAYRLQLNPFRWGTTLATSENLKKLKEGKIRFLAFFVAEMSRTGISRRSRKVKLWKIISLEETVCSQFIGKSSVWVTCCSWIVSEFYFFEKFFCKRWYRWNAVGNNARCVEMPLLFIAVCKEGGQLSQNIITIKSSYCMSRPSV